MANRPSRAKKPAAPMITARDAYSQMEALQDELSITPYRHPGRGSLLERIRQSKITYTRCYLAEDRVNMMLASAAA